MNAQAITRHDLEAKIVQRSWEDEGFRKEFPADPTGSLSEHLQVPSANLPAITVHEEEPGSSHVVLPAKPANASALSDHDLERIAGGVSAVVWIPAAAIVTVNVIGAVGATGVAAIAVSVPVSVVEGGW
jgi:hypothetical protein